MPRQIELPQLSREVDHFVVRLRGGGEALERGGPVEECEGLEEGDAVADAAAFLDHPAGYGRGNCAGGGDFGKIDGEIGYGEIGGRWSGVRVRVFAVVVFNQSVESVGYKGFFGR